MLNKKKESILGFIQYALNGAQMGEWYTNTNTPLIKEWIKQNGDSQLRDIFKIAEAIFKLDSKHNKKQVRSVAILAEAMHYISKGGIEKYIEELIRDEHDFGYVNRQVRKRIVDIENELININ